MESRSSSSHSSISSLSRKEDFDHFEYNVTSPILESKKKKVNKKLVVGKLVDQVKKFKKQAPKIHNDNDDNENKNDNIDYHSSGQIDVYDTKGAAAPNESAEFLESRMPAFKSNFSENHHKFLSKIKSYHSAHLHVITSIIHSDDGEEEVDEEEEDESKTRRHHRQYLNMTRPTKKYFRKKQKPKDQVSIHSLSSTSSSNSVSHKRKKLNINLASKKKRSEHKKKRAPLLNDNNSDNNNNNNNVQPEKSISLIQIRQQMMDFKTPADWTCISSKVNKNPTTAATNFKLIPDHNLINDKINDEIKRIQSSKLMIQDYLNKIKQLDIDTERHLQLYSSIDTKSKEMGQSSTNLQKSRHLLQQAYSRHMKLAVKNTMNPSIRLENLQIKVQALHKSHFLGLGHCGRWTFSFGLILFICRI
ncbi:hypothetical protein BD408DRAFT_424560 [Parasitella parasitica]|nr:hypothetical protein BD408DRAFT_424560 [Parasitella parasitica]